MVKEFGKTKEGEVAKLYTLKNNKGMEIDVTDYGACLVNVRIPKENKVYDVVLGYDSVLDYENAGTYFGAAAGIRLLSGGDLTTTKDGQRNIAGVPFI